MWGVNKRDIDHLNFYSKIFIKSHHHTSCTPFISTVSLLIQLSSILPWIIAVASALLFSPHSLPFIPSSPVLTNVAELAQWVPELTHADGSYLPIDKGQASEHSAGGPWLMKPASHTFFPTVVLLLEMVPPVVKDLL